MARRRYHDGSKGGEERYEKGQHHREEFNDEWRHDQDPDDHMMRNQSGAENYGYMNPSGRSVLEGPEMIREDHRAIANLPQEVMIKPYPKTGPYMPEEIDDTINSVDGQMDYDDQKRRKGFYPKKV